MSKTLIVVAAILLIGCESPARPTVVPQPIPVELPAYTPPLIEYTVTGSGSAAIVYESQGGAFVDVGTVPVPWSHQHTAIWGGAYLCVQNKGDGCIVAQIYRGGVLVQEGGVCGHKSLVISKGWY